MRNASVPSTGGAHTSRRSGRFLLVDRKIGEELSSVSAANILKLILRSVLWVIRLSKRNGF